MNILALDTSALTASVAIFKDGVSVFENNITCALTHSETIMPMIDYALRSVNLTVKDIDLYAVANGPGSFTGVRIGASAVKGLAYAADKKVFGVNTLLALACNLSYLEGVDISPIMDARRGQVYNAVYSFENGRAAEKIAPRALSVYELCAGIKENTYFVGDGVDVHMDRIKALLGKKARFAPPHLRLQKAASSAYAALCADEKDYISPEALKVLYLRKSQAEREKEEKERNKLQ